jgi:hypothetical protein
MSRGASIPPKAMTHTSPPPRIPVPSISLPSPSLSSPALPSPSHPSPPLHLPSSSLSFLPLPSLFLRFLGGPGASPRKIFLISQMLVGEFYRILNPINMHLDISFFACTFAFSSSCHLVWCVRVYVRDALTRVYTL